MFCIKFRKQRKIGRDETREESKVVEPQNVKPKDVAPKVVDRTSTTVSLPPLKPLDLPKIILEHQFALSDQGWSTVTYDGPSDTLYRSSEALFKSGRDFFNLPESYKEGFKTPKGSEEGWSRVEGEKEFITLRTLDNTPEELKEAASAYWSIAGEYLNQLLGYLARSLGLPAEALTAYSEPCIKLGSSRTATMLRIFRYEGFEGQESKLVAEPHKDLGLLSLVVGDTPGLEVHDRHAQQWFPIERSYDRPAGSILAGRQLQKLSNGRYTPGPHLVRSYPDPQPEAKESTESSTRNYRFSIVFVLRAHSTIPVNSDNLTTPITGEFKTPLRDMVAGDLFKDLRNSHYNINTGIEQRKAQRQKLAEIKQQQDLAASIETANENENTSSS